MLRPKETVRAGYDKVALQYARARQTDSSDAKLLPRLAERLGKGALILDAGCGCGHPVGTFLSKSFKVIGMDFSNVQLRCARKTIPNSMLACGDLTNLPFRDSAFDAVVSYYSIIHVPRDEHPELLHNIHRILKQGGLALLCLGAGDLPMDKSTYMNVPMYWSHHDKEANLRMLKERKFSVLWSEIVQDPIDPASSHLFVLAKKA
jgi:ubiquinone/menaquinone biosynthesis C-methylase UbiE